MASKISRFIDRKRALAHWASVEAEWEKKGLVCADEVLDDDLTVVVSTYHERFDKCLKRIVKQVATLFHGTKVIVVANGCKDAHKQGKYLRELETYLAELPCVELIKYESPVGLSQMWNAAVEISQTDNILVLNDDLVLEEGFENEIRSLLGKAPLQIVNKSWSHFLITKDTISKVGWFDERFKGIGNEDWDYEARIALAGLELQYADADHVLNEVLKPKDYSYGTDMEVVNKKYSQINLDFFNEKWEQSENAQDGFAFVPGAGCYVRPKLDDLSFRFS